MTKASMLAAAALAIGAYGGGNPIRSSGSYKRPVRIYKKSPTKHKKVSTAKRKRLNKIAKQSRKRNRK